MFQVGFPPKEPAVLVAVQSLTQDHVVEVMKDEAVKEIFGRAETEFGLQSGTYAFSGEVLEKMESDSPAGLLDDSVHLHYQEFHKLVDDLVPLPVAQKNLLKYELWLQDNIFDDRTQAFGYSAPDPVFLARAECRSWDNISAILSTYRQMALDAGKKFSFGKGGSMFSVDVVTKLDHS
ncbi:hypothetical protein C8R47DRAFT_1210855 [Mycena vitilis]|nr:hypothetical protein C8R47DRAFT_1210855 [Mycena vitilis]